jgi:hypothetical protein
LRSGQVDRVATRLGRMRQGIGIGVRVRLLSAVIVEAWNRVVRCLRAAGRGALAAAARRELGCGRGVTCWRRLRDWQQAGVWEQLHHRLLDWLGDDGQVDWSRAAIDSVSVRARRGGN